MKGVVRTRVGYSGGEKKNPTYRDLGNHTETIQIDFDPRIITYKKLLDLFWEDHDPHSKHYGRQYMPVVFYHSENQRKLAEESGKRLARETRTAVHTRILPAGIFYRAEDYHQKYMLRRVRLLLKEYEALYPKLVDFTDSTAVTRVNAYLGGHGTAKQLATEIDRLGLSEKARKMLTKRVR